MCTRLRYVSESPKVTKEGRVTCWGQRPEALNVLQELYQIHDGRLDLPLIMYQGYGKWPVKSRDQGTHSLRREVSGVHDTLEREGKVSKLQLVLEKLHSIRR